MAAARKSVRLFSLGSDITGDPRDMDPSTFKSINAKEAQDLERWIKKKPELLGEPLIVITSQFSGWDKTKDRPDLLALDKKGKLVVIEIKLDSSGSGQDLQAIRYAAYVATLTSDQVVDLFLDFVNKDADGPISRSEAADQLSNFPNEGLEALDDDDAPRIILAAKGYQPGVTSTVLWLRDAFRMDISCVKIEPYVLHGELILASTTLIPLPEAAEYEVRMQAKRQKASSGTSVRVDFEKAEAFIDSIPSGKWSSYKDVATAGQSPKAAQSIGGWLSKSGHDMPTVYRVLNAQGKVSAGWGTSNPSLPATAADVRQKLVEEGVEFDEQNRANQDQRWTSDDWASSADDTLQALAD